MTDTDKASDEAQIREVLDRKVAAHRSKDIEALVADDAPDILLCDLAPPLMHRGGDRAGLAAWLETWRGPIGIALRDLEISASPTLAFATSLNRMTGLKKDGAEVDVWFRSTVCLKKAGGRWQVVHEHTSVPFHMDGSFRAAVDLEP